MCARLQNSIYAAWVTSTVDAPSGEADVGNYCSLAFDPNNHPHIIYYDYYNGRPKHAWLNGTTWKIETMPVLDVNADNGKYISMAIDGSGNMHVSYYAIDNNTSSSYLIYAKGVPGTTATTWTNTIVNAGGNTAATSTGQYTSIALDSTGYPSIVDNTAGVLTCWSNSGGTIWTSKNIDSAANPTWNSIVIDKNNEKHVSYLIDGTASKELRYKNLPFGASSWGSLQTIDTPEAIGSTGYPVSIAFDTSENPCVAYCYNYPIFGGVHLSKYAQSTLGTSWTTVLLGNYTEGSSGAYTSLAFDLNNIPHVVSIGSLVREDTYVAGSWATSFINDYSDVRFTSVKIDKNNKSSIAYYVGVHSLRFANNTETTLSTNTVTTGTGGSNLNNAHPYPSFGNISKGDKINFAGITPGADVKIFTVSGNLAKSLKADANGVVPAWDGSVDGGGKAASGTYIVRASDNKGNKKTFKILLVK